MTTNKNKIIYIGIAALLMLTIPAQTATASTLTGRVDGQDPFRSYPLEGALVELVTYNITLFTYTDAGGYYSFSEYDNNGWMSQLKVSKERYTSNQWNVPPWETRFDVALIGEKTAIEFVYETANGFPKGTKEIKQLKCTMDENGVIYVDMYDGDGRCNNMVDNFVSRFRSFMKDLRGR